LSKVFACLVVLSAGFFLPTRGFAAADAAAGKQVFETQCAACHSLDPDDPGMGPSLKGVVGRKSGALDDYDYSPAMQGAGKTWDPGTLDAYLADPQGQVPGTKMVFPGLKDSNQRSAVIAFLATLK
jgi:cytochrome c